MQKIVTKPNNYLGKKHPLHVESFKYFGHSLTSGFKDDQDTDIEKLQIEYERKLAYT